MPRRPGHRSHFRCFKGSRDLRQAHDFGFLCQASTRSISDRISDCVGGGALSAFASSYLENARAAMVSASSVVSTVLKAAAAALTISGRSTNPSLAFYSNSSSCPASDTTPNPAFKVEASTRDNSVLAITPSSDIKSTGNCVFSQRQPQSAHCRRKR